MPSGKIRPGTTEMCGRPVRGYRVERHWKFTGLGDRKEDYFGDSKAIGRGDTDDL